MVTVTLKISLDQLDALRSILNREEIRIQNEAAAITSNNEPERSKLLGRQSFEVDTVRRALLAS